ncbi:MAG: bifunctional phosphoribosylaminoimidazolecarboxamide formyltransferase/IMP cyclohydrolase, partial [Candidatus Cloacimonetes bacterium]|nr:bifunctional phosphoribosylaminoimidazolecarboxamide formyltransferase/IMP cyclohydrolase [Candidatus Cloacimonadota bacterium]
PDFTEEALQLLYKKSDRRVIKFDKTLLPDILGGLQINSCLDGYLTQTPDIWEDIPEMWEYPTILRPTPAQRRQLIFAWQVVKMLKSNAICFCKNKQTLGLGIGQTSRIDSLNIAIERAVRMGHNLKGSFCASDGFFPFRDSIDRLHEIGVKCIIQPGGSKADPEVIAACNEYNIAMIHTGRRHFRH